MPYKDPEEGRRHRRERYRANPEPARERARRYRQAHLEEVREWHRQHGQTDQKIASRRRFKYGISTEQFNRLLKAQKGRCANPGCRIPLKPGRGQAAICVDHDHSCCPGPRSCGDCVRGLLCNGCNTALGYTQDSADRLRGLADYLDTWEGV